MTRGIFCEKNPKRCVAYVATNSIDASIMSYAQNDCLRLGQSKLSRYPLN